MNTDNLREAAKRLPKDGFWMSIPARPDRDPDLLLLDAANEIDLARARIADLEAKLAAAEAARLRAEDDLRLRKNYADECRTQSGTIARLMREIEVADKQRDAALAAQKEAEKVAVWAARTAASGNLLIWSRCVEHGTPSFARMHNGTDADILRALKEAHRDQS